MQNRKLKLWISWTAFVVAAVSLLVWEYRADERKSTILRNQQEADWNTFKANLKSAEGLVHHITGAFNDKTNAYDATAGQGPALAASKLPESHAIGYPFLVWSVREDWAGFMVGHLDEDRYYFKTPTGTDMLPYIDNNHVRGLRWLVLLTHGFLETRTYHPENFKGIQIPKHNAFTDAWVVDLENMSVVAHRRFTDDPLPEALHEDEYIKAQKRKLESEIKSWLEKNAA